MLLRNVMNITSKFFRYKIEDRDRWGAIHERFFVYEGAGMNEQLIGLKTGFMISIYFEFR